MNSKDKRKIDLEPKRECFSENGNHIFSKHYQLSDEYFFMCMVCKLRKKELD